METKICSSCGSHMILRTSSKTGNKFWGCSNYPRCKQTEFYRHQPETIVRKQVDFSRFNPSRYQDACRIALQESSDNLVIEAVAGSGKSTTLMWLLQFIPTNKKCTIVSFNKDIAKSNAEKCPNHVKSSTMNSLGASNIRAARFVKFNEFKVDDYIKQYMQAVLEDDLDNNFEEYKEYAAYTGVIKKLVELHRNYLILNPDSKSCNEFANKFNDIDLDNDFEDWIIDSVDYIFGLIYEDENQIDFDDQVFWCAIGRVPCEKFDYFMGDEIQDWNPAQIQFAINSVSRNGRFIGVGDRYQSIYGFRGADTYAIPNIIEAFNAKRLPLSICYRCQGAVIELINETFPHIEFLGKDNNEHGIVNWIKEHELESLVQDGDLILCRNNAPLVRPCFNLIKKGIKAIIKGRDIGSGLINLVLKIQKKNKNQNDFDSFIIVCEDYKVTESMKLTQRNKGKQAETLEDQCDTILAIAEDCDSIKSLINRIGNIFSDNNGTVTFSSVHKAKGLESNNVFILKPELMPSSKAVTDEDIQQEENIKYVAYTRSKKALYFVKSNEN